MEGRVGFDKSDLKPSHRSGGRDEPARNLRDLSMRLVSRNQKIIHEWFDAATDLDGVWDSLLGLRLQHEGESAPPVLGSLTYKNGAASSGKRQPLFEVNSARISRRAGPNGNELHLLIIQLTQRRRAYFDQREQSASDAGNYREIGHERTENPDFWFRGGATLHIDLRDGKLLRIIRKRIDDDDRLREEVAFRIGDETGTVAATAYGSEPFAFMHKGEADDISNQNKGVTI